MHLRNSNADRTGGNRNKYAEKYLKSKKDDKGTKGGSPKKES